MITRPPAPPALTLTRKVLGLAHWALISPITFYLVTLNMVFAFFESFGVIDAVTKGGPGDATMIMVYKLYKDGFIGLNLGSSGAQSVILMALVIGLTMLQFKYAEKKVTYR